MPHIAPYIFTQPDTLSRLYIGYSSVSLVFSGGIPALLSQLLFRDFSCKNNAEVGLCEIDSPDPHTINNW